jgi:hypothetical protein
LERTSPVLSLEPSPIANSLVDHDLETRDIAAGTRALPSDASRLRSPNMARLGSGPSFSLGGSGRLVSFTICRPQPGHKIATPNDAKSLVWSIQSSAGYPDRVPVAHMNLVYRSVPEGYTQTVPSRGPCTCPDCWASVLFFRRNQRCTREGWLLLHGQDNTDL